MQVYAKKQRDQYSLEHTEQDSSKKCLLQWLLLICWIITDVFPQPFFSVNMCMKGKHLFTFLTSLLWTFNWNGLPNIKGLFLSCNKLKMQFAEISFWAVYQSICKIWTAQATNQNSPFHPWLVQPYNTGDESILHVNLHPKFHFQVPEHDQLHFQWLCCLNEEEKMLKKLFTTSNPN